MDAPTVAVSGVVSLIVADPAGDAQDDDASEAANEAVEIVEVAAEGAEAIDLGQDDGDTLYILTATENGYGKRTPLADHPRKGRGTQGVIGIQTTARNGRLVGAVLLRSGDEVLLISDGGTLVRTRAAEISRVGRNTQGVTLMRLAEGEALQALERLDASLDEEEAAEAPVAPAPSPPLPLSGGHCIVQAAPRRPLGSCPSFQCVWETFLATVYCVPRPGPAPWPTGAPAACPAPPNADPRPPSSATPTR